MSLISQGSDDNNMYLRPLVMRNLFCAIYESGYLKAELEHDNDEAAQLPSSDNMSSEWDNGSRYHSSSGPMRSWDW